MGESGFFHVGLALILRVTSRGVPVRGVASGTYEHDKPHRTARYRVFEIERGAITSDHVRVWQRGNGIFAADPGTSPQSNYGT